MGRITKAEIVNMIMIENKSTGKVLVLDRRGSWPGLTFPGGHVEKGEPFLDAAVREAKEETGLDVSKLRSCGVVHWANKKTGDCYLEFLYKTSNFYGELIGGTIEGDILWMTPDELKSSDRLSPNFELYLPMFFDNKYSELYFDWDGEGWNSKPEYK